MVGLMLVSILMIKNMVMEYFNGQMEEDMKDNGLTGINMEEEHI